MKNFILEVGTEELPALEIESIAYQFKENLISLLKEEGFKFSDYKVFSTPRRFAIFIIDLSEKGEDKIIEKIGPPYEVAFKENKPTQSAIKFAQSINVNIENLYKVERNGKFYIAGKQTVKGKSLEVFISENFEKILKNINVKKSMFWLEDKSFKFSRPIRWILCLYGNKVIEFSFLNLRSSNYTYAHRILSKGRIIIENADEYEAILERNFVIADSKKRYNKILNEIKKLEYQAYFDENLYKEINGLVEYPFLALCEFEEEYLKLPEKIIITAMKVHQRYIALFKDGKLTNKFISISNNYVNEQMKRNFSKVLRARLEDAKFYFENDIKKSLNSYFEDLKDIQFIENAGSVYDKIERVLKISNSFEKIKVNNPSLLISKNPLKTLKIAIYLYKIDLASSMIRDGKEFTELEGYISSEYVKHLLRKEETNEILLRITGEKIDIDDINYISDVIYDWTLFEKPKTIEGVILGIIDRIDSIITILSTGYKIKGNYDPLGLKKLTYELFKIIIENDVDFSLKTLIDLEDVIEFLYQRLENYLVEKLNFEHELTDAVISIKLDNINEVYKRVEFLNKVKKSDYNKFSDIILAQKRAYNIIKDKELTYSVNEKLFENSYELNVYKAINEFSPLIENYLNQRNYEEVFRILAELKNYIDEFFNNVFVMVDNEQIRNNRLALIKLVKNLYDKFADFSKIPIQV
jgi:glycyl-tRNA synthetase beta chain